MTTMRQQWSGLQLSMVACLSALQILNHLQSVSAEGEACYKAANNSPGTCVGIKSCAPYVALLQQEGAKAGAFLRSTICYFDGNNPVVCCPPYNNQQSPGPRPIPPGPAIFGDGFDQQSCGYSPAGHNRVVGGEPAPLGAWPWIAALGYRNKKDPSKPKWLCGGTLVSAQHVLTAGHCVYNRTDLYLVRLGEHDIKSDNDGADPINVNVVMGIIHPGYSAVNYVNDIALLKLKRPVSFTPAIHPICLPTPNTIYKDYTGTFPFIAGWGSLYFHGPTSQVLQQVQVPVVSQEKCYNTYEPFKTQVIDERVICAGFRAGGKDACQGDSGGPMMSPIDPEKYAIIGIVSFGFKCAEPDIPGVYTRVAYFLDWIRDTMQI